MTTLSDLNHRLTAIKTNAAALILQAETAYTEIYLLNQRLDQLAAEGMYNFHDPPLELWESRNGNDAKYLRLRFHETPHHCPYVDVPRPYDGPNGQRQIYIGADPERIAHARALIHRRTEWLALQTHIDRHAKTINRIWRQLLP